MLPDSWIAKIFDHMSAMYGSKFADLWRGSDLESVRRTWAEKLGGFESMPGAIKEALNALDSKPFPPTLPEFLALCREAGTRHIQSKPAIEYKPSDEEIKRSHEAQKAIAEAVKRMSERDHMAWAKNPKSQEALDGVVSGAKTDSRLREILAGLVANGKCSSEFKLLTEYKVAA